MPIRTSSIIDLSNPFHVIDFFLIFRMFRYKPNEPNDKEIIEAHKTAQN